MKTKIDLTQIRADYEAFMQPKKSLILSFITPEGLPFSSTAPFVQVDGKFYVYVSRVAEHYKLLEQNKVVDVLFIADESATQNFFATERARWQCAPKNLGNEGNEEIFEALDNLHNKKMMDLLRTLDFSIFELTPLKGRYVVGFGKAFDMDFSEDTLTHVVIDKKK